MKLPSLWENVTASVDDLLAQVDSLSDAATKAMNRANAAEVEVAKLEIECKALASQVKELTEALDRERIEKVHFAKLAARHHL